jgi:hypothetical protein
MEEEGVKLRENKECLAALSKIYAAEQNLATALQRMPPCEGRGPAMRASEVLGEASALLEEIAGGIAGAGYESEIQAV